MDSERLHRAPGGGTAETKNPEAWPRSARRGLPVCRAEGGGDLPSGVVRFIFTGNRPLAVGAGGRDQPGEGGRGNAAAGEGSSRRARPEASQDAESRAERARGGPTLSDLQKGALNCLLRAIGAADGFQRVPWRPLESWATWRQEAQIVGW